MLEETIKYYEEASWERYFNIYLAELYSSVEGVLKLREELVKELTSAPVSELISKSDIYKEILFGGFRADESKPFADNALALFYKRILGVGIDDKDISIVISRLKEGLSLEDATKDILCKEFEVSFITILGEISSKLKAIYKLLREVVKEPPVKEYKIENSDVGVRAVQDVLNAGKKILPLYNPLSFFIISIYSIPSFYLRESYPKFEEAKQLLRKYGIHVVKLLEPDIPDEELRKQREVVGLERGCVGDLVRDIIVDLFSIFQLEDLKNFFTIEDEFNKHVEANVKKLKESIVVDKFKHVIEDIRRGGELLDYYDPEKKRCKRYKYLFYGEHVYKGSIEGGKVILKTSYSSSTLNYTEFFAFLAPQMFLGLAYIRPASPREFIWLCTLGWES